MCDYSLEHLVLRAANVGDKLVPASFGQGLTGGFCAMGEPNVAACLQPGTELAFEREIESQAAFRLFPPSELGALVARSLRGNEAHRHRNHDALELPSGQVVLLTRLRAGQHATALQLPATERPHEAAQERRKPVEA
jgi:hypothetical protein